jgi:hypothetical protein
VAQSQYPAHAVRAKTSEVVAYHKDESLPGKPLYILIPGGLIALAALSLIIVIAYKTWFDGSLDEGRAWPFLDLLAPAYIVGAAMFSYGYELYDIPKTIRLTLVIVVITVSAVVIIAVLFALLGVAGSSSSSKSSSKSSSSSSSSSGSGVGDAIGSFVGGSSSHGTTLSPSYGSGSGIGPIFLNTGGQAVTHEVTHEVLREVPVSPPAPQLVTCPFCGRSYVPAENKFECPQCGAATPTELLPPAAGAQRESNA